MLFDVPDVVAAAEAGERCRLEAGSFFDAVPEGGDGYVLKSILHNWDDDAAARIQRVCRRSGGFRLVRAVPSAAGPSVIEAMPAR